LDACVIFFASLFSLGIVFVESRVLQIVLPAVATETVSFVIQGEKQYSVGQSFSMPVEITEIASAINAVRVDVKYDPSFIEVESISTEGSFATVFIEKKIDNQLGYAMISGGLPYPGYSGGNSLFVTYIFRGIRPGLAKVDFLPSSMVLANDGVGSNLLIKSKTCIVFNSTSRKYSYITD
jgi:hypothetical protein